MVKRKKALIALLVGLFIIFFSQILTQYIELSDVLKGILIGIGLGLMVIPLIAIQYKSRG